MSSSNDSKQKLLAVALVAIIGLLGFNGYMWLQNSEKDALLSKQTTEIDETEKLKAELEKQYYESLSELEEMRGSNEELNALIDEQKAELKKQKSKISGLIRTKKDLAAAKEQMDALRLQLNEYITANTRLQEEKEALTQQTIRLNQEKDVLSTDLTNERSAKEELISQKAVLVSEKENLETERQALSAKVNLGSVVKVKQIDVSAWKLKKNGKEVKKKYARNTDFLKICFTAIDNKVVEPGAEQFFIRVINPLGETLAIENLGSGVMINSSTNEEVRYTKSTEIPYSNEEVNACVQWKPDADFQKGTHDVEVYNKGYLVGKGNITLK